MQKFVVHSKGILNIFGIERLIQDFTNKTNGTENVLPKVLIWGKKPRTKRSMRYAEKYDLPLYHLEDGFLRSYATGKSTPPLSLVIDTQGIYYDSTCSSALENLLQSNFKIRPNVELDLADTIKLVVNNSLSKYNNGADYTKPQSNHQTTRGSVLVVDQTVGDMSVVLGSADERTFADMIIAARRENPRAIVYVKTHPEVISGQKKGYLTSTQPDERTVILRNSINPISLIKQMDKVYVVTSTMGFEALLAGKSVVCFGVPWYAGWGLTDDRCLDSTAWARRTQKRSVEELFVAAYINYTRYLNPVTHQLGTILDVINWLIRQKEMARFMHGLSHKGRIIGFGFKRWKATNLRPMLGLHANLVSFVSKTVSLEKLRLGPEDTVVYWGATPHAGLEENIRKSKARLLHIEDGFIRSVGLGSDMIRPQSIVMDERGIYFDATRPSDLEWMLNNEDFSKDLHRAKFVHEFIINHRITKYNLEPQQSASWKNVSKKRKIILVPGQVEDDASIVLGCTTVAKNLDLLKRVRLANSAAFVVYKPHPDVISGNRKGHIPYKSALEYADHIELDICIISCIEACDEVHTMTSLAGFDALLRSKKVVTYGQPFYAGWGLTEDLAENATAFERRKRRINLNELIAGVLLRYPVYWDWDLKGYTNCEAVLHRIVEERRLLEITGSLNKLRVGYLRRQLRKIGALSRSF